MNTLSKPLATERYRTLTSPIGQLCLVVNDRDELVQVLFEKDGIPVDGVEHADCAQEAARQLEQYFEGERRSFDLSLAPSGTEFQRAVWSELLKIPFGETRSYGQIA